MSVIVLHVSILGFESFIQATVAMIYFHGGDDPISAINDLVKALVLKTSEPKARLRGLVTLLNHVIETESKYLIVTGKY